MTPVAITFTPDGRCECLYTEVIDLGTIGELSIQRATTIEFDNHTQYWRVRDPTGFALFNSPSRQACLDWERQYLQTQEDTKHELQHRPGAASAGLRGRHAGGSGVRCRKHRATDASGTGGIGVC